MKRRIPLKIAAIYLIIGCIWILLSDKMVALIALDSHMLTFIQTIKGWLFIIITSAILFILINRNLLQHERIDEELRESERKLSTLMGNIRGMVYRCLSDTNWTMLFVSDGCHELTGYKPEDLLENKRIAYNNLIHPDDQERVWQQVQSALDKGRHFHLEYRILTKSGKEKWVTERGVGIFSKEGHIVAIEGLITDITERRRAEAQLRHLAKAIDHSGDAIVITDAKGVIVYVNSSFERATGYSVEDAVGSDVHLFDSGMHDDDFYEEMRDIVSKGESWCGRFSNKRKDEALIDQDTCISPILDSAGKIKGYISVQRDVTEQLKMEERLKQTQKLEAIGTLAGGIAHDFNNILGSVIGYTELALEDISEENPAHDNLQQVFKAGLRARDLVQQILTFSRRSERELKPVQTSLIAKEALKFLRASLPTTIDIDRRIESDALIMGDPTQLHQVLMNLCTNAGHAMMEKGGTLTMSLEDVVIEAEYTKNHPDLTPGKYQKLTVSDTGHGMRPEVQSRIFEPFFTTKPKGEGTGLGLSVVHGIVNSCGGFISSHSIPDKGTQFNIFFPVLLSQGIAETGTNDAIHAGTEQLLFVDDEMPLVTVGQKMLESLGYKVVATTDSSEALELFKREPGAFDLVITDMTMPKMTGEELGREINKLKPDVPIILCTGYRNLISERKARAAGIRDIISKPIIKRDMAIAIRNILDNH